MHAEGVASAVRNSQWLVSGSGGTSSSTSFTGAADLRFLRERPRCHFHHVRRAFSMPCFAPNSPAVSPLLVQASIVRFHSAAVRRPGFFSRPVMARA